MPPMPGATYPDQSGRETTDRDPHPEQTKRRDLATAGIGVASARPRSPKARGADRRQDLHTTSTPESPNARAEAIVIGVIGASSGMGSRGKSSRRRVGSA